MEKFLTPFYPEQNLPKTLQEACLKPREIKRIKEANVYEKIIAREVVNWFDNSKMVGILHANSINMHEVFNFQIQLKRNNMYMKTYGSTILREALQDSPYAAVLPLTEAKFYFIFSPDTPVLELKKALRKVPQLILLGGVLNGKLLHLEDFLKYGTMHLLDAQAELVSTLQNAGGVNLNRQLTHHQSTLVTQLNQIGTNEKASTEEESVPV